MPDRRRTVLVLIATLVVVDLAAAAYLSVLWGERHAARSKQAAPQDEAPSGPRAALEHRPR